MHDDVVQGESMTVDTKQLSISDGKEIKAIADGMKKDLDSGWSTGGSQMVAAQALPDSGQQTYATGEDATRWEYNPQTNMYYDAISGFHYNSATGEYYPPGDSSLPNQIVEASSLTGKQAQGGAGSSQMQLANINEDNAYAGAEAGAIAPMSSYFKQTASVIPPPTKMKAMSLRSNVQRVNFHKKTLDDTCLGPMARGNRGAKGDRSDYRPDSTADPEKSHQFY